MRSDRMNGCVGRVSDCIGWRTLALVLSATIGLAAAGVQVASAGTAKTFKKTFKDCPACPVMVVIPAGKFEMGSSQPIRVHPDQPPRVASPVRQITFARPFAMGADDVTVAQFTAFVRASGYHVPHGGCVGYGQVLFDWTWDRVEDGATHGPNYPVTCMSWTDARAYAAWLAKKTGKPYRLPTEAEWEYVARTGNSTTWPWGNDVSKICQYVNGADDALRTAKLSDDDVPGGYAHCNDGFTRLAPAGSLKPNAFGVYDMIGNAWEWVEDCWTEFYPAAPTDGRAVERPDCQKRSLRGGSWRSGLLMLEPFFRGSDPPDWRSHTYGFRVVRDLSASDR